MVEVVELKAPSVASPPQELPSIRPTIMASASADFSGSRGSELDLPGKVERTCHTHRPL